MSLWKNCSGGREEMFRGVGKKCSGGMEEKVKDNTTT